MRSLTLAELATIVHGEVRGIDPLRADDLQVGPDVVTDSRRVTPGALYVARVGEQVDGHRFVRGAVEAGAGAALVAVDHWTGEEGVPVVAVADTEVALGLLARHVVDRAAPALVVLGVTGSMGKTSTKDLLAAVLATQAPTVAPENSFNTEVGVSLTATRISDDTGFLVSEMGARGIGHIAVLCELTPPRVGVVLNVAHAHIGEFGSQQAIAQAKGEIVEALPPDGWAVLNADDPLVVPMASRTAARIAWFADGARPVPAGGIGDREGFVVRSSEVGHDRWGRHHFTLHVDGRHPRLGELRGPYGTVRLATAGRPQVANSLAAAAAAVAAGMLPGDVVHALDGAGVTSRWRMELTELADSTMVVNDAYNANPDAMVGALGTAATMAGDNDRRLGVVLGDMLELGNEAVADHTAVGRAVAEAGAAWAIFVGDHAGIQAEAAVAAGLADEAVRVVQDGSTASTVLPQLLGPGDVVLIKGSRGMALETVAARLVEEGAR